MNSELHSYVSVPLNEEHHTSFFDCGDNKLNRWLDRQAIPDQKLGRSRTHVWLDEGDYVVAYFTLLQSTLREDDEESSVLRRLRPKSFPRNAELPGVLVGKLAIDQALQGKGYLFELLAEAYYLAYESVMLIGGTVLVIEPAGDEPRLRKLYEKFGFVSLAGSQRMFLNFEEFNEGSDISDLARKTDSDREPPK